MKNNLLMQALEEARMADRGRYVLINVHDCKVVYISDDLSYLIQFELKTAMDAIFDLSKF